MLRAFLFFSVMVLGAIPLRTASADWLQLRNGDTIQGEMLEMSLKEVRFRHPVLGDFTVPRDSIHAIVLGDFQGGKRVMRDGSEAPPETPEEVIDRLVNPEFDSKAVKELESGAKRQKTPEDVIDQLRREGVDTNLTDQLHLMLPGFGSPKVQEHFQSRVRGLMDGSLSIQDIRNEAIDARDQLQVLMDELGPSGAALQGYFGILDNFIKKTAPKGDAQDVPRGRMLPSGKRLPSGNVLPGGKAIPRGSAPPTDNPVPSDHSQSTPGGSSLDPNTVP